MEPQLVLLSFVAGFISISSPCVLPLIPVVMAGSTGSRLRPLLIVLGMSFTFTLMGVLTSQAGAVAGFSSALRFAGIALIILLGAVLAVEKLDQYFVLYSSALMNRLNLGQPSGREGVLGALILGLSLGVVWIPCVGPILGVVLTRVAMEGEVLMGGFSLFLYSLGMGVPMLAIAYSGKYALSRMESVSQHNLAIRRTAGVIIILMGIALLFGIDRKLQAILAPYFPELPL